MRYIVYRCRWTDHGYAVSDCGVYRTRKRAIATMRDLPIARGLHYETVQYPPGAISGAVIAMHGALGNPVSI